MSVVASPRWFPHALDLAGDRLLVAEKTEEDYREAAFLDERSLNPERAQHWIPWAAAAGVVPHGARRDLHYIFHIGHVGSTLISRLLGELPEVLALREPLVLRTLAEAPAAIPERIDTLTALLSRTFHPQQRAMAKATSFVSEIAAELVPTGSKALLLYTAPERYIANIFAGENSRRVAAISAAGRLARLLRRSPGGSWEASSEGETIVLGWAAEMTSLVQASERLPADTTLFMDFDDFLAAPAESLFRLARFFDLPLGADGAERLARHPLMGRYSKAVEHDFSAAHREELLREAGTLNGPEIARARAWLDAAAARDDRLGRALDIAASTGGAAAANP